MKYKTDKPSGHTSFSAALAGQPEDCGKEDSSNLHPLLLNKNYRLHSVKWNELKLIESIVQRSSKGQV